MNAVPVYLEAGTKRTFAGAIDWPGWCRSGRDEAAALQAFCDYGPRYAGVLDAAQIEFQAPVGVSAFVVVERHAGSVTTDFGAPDAALASDTLPFDLAELHRCQALLTACWQAFDHAVLRATGEELRKGPRGGGRELAAVMQHVLDANISYLARLAEKQKRSGAASPREEFARDRQAVLSALAGATRGETPEHGPRGGIIWTPRYFVRRVAWHVLDHAWEIEDRLE